MDAASSLQGNEMEMAQQCLAVLATPATRSELDSLQALVLLHNAFQIELLPVQLRQVSSTSCWARPAGQSSLKCTLTISTYMS